MPATTAAVSPGSRAARIAPVCEDTLTAGTGVAPACHSAAAPPTSSSAPSGRAVRANSPAAAASSAGTATSGHTSHGAGGGLQVSTPSTRAGVSPWRSGTVHSKTVWLRSGSSATAGGNRPSVIQWVRWSCQT